MKPILVIFIFIFSRLLSIGYRQTTKSTKSTHQLISSRLSTLSTFSIVYYRQRGKADEWEGGVKVQTLTALDRSLKRSFMGVFSGRGGGVRNLLLYSICARSGMFFGGMVDFEGEDGEREVKLIAHLIGGNGRSKNLVAENVIFAGLFWLEGWCK